MAHRCGNETDKQHDMEIDKYEEVKNVIEQHIGSIGNIGINYSAMTSITEIKELLRELDPTINGSFMLQMDLIINKCKLLMPNHVSMTTMPMPTPTNSVSSDTFSTTSTFSSSLLSTANTSSDEEKQEFIEDLTLLPSALIFRAGSGPADGLMVWGEHVLFERFILGLLTEIKYDKNLQIEFEECALDELCNDTVNYMVRYFGDCQEASEHAERDYVDKSDIKFVRKFKKF